MRIRNFLTLDAVKRTIVTLVLSRLDYCTALLSAKVIQVTAGSKLCR